MGFAFALDAALEGAKETVQRVVDSVTDKYQKYQSWMSEAEAAVPHLTNIDENRRVHVYSFNDAVLMVKAADALTKALQQVQKKVAVDLSKLPQMNDLKKVGIAATPEALDISAYQDHSWGQPTEKHIKTLKENGWTGSKASTFARAFAAVLKNVGVINAFQGWTTSAVNEYTNTKDKERYRELVKIVKQAQQIVKIRHVLLNDIYKQFTAVKKTI